MTEISVESVCEFITSHGGKVKNITLVSNFKKLLNDPATRDAARQQFKECVNTVAVVKTENGEKYVQLKKKYRSPSSSSRSSVASDANVPPPEAAKQSAAPAAEVVKAKDAGVAKQHSSEVARQQKTPEIAWKSGSKAHHNPESPEKGHLNNSYNPTQDVPFADGSPQKAHDSPRHKHHKSNRSTPEHHKSTGSIPREGSTSSRKSRDEKWSSDSHHGSPHKEKHKHKEEGKVENPVDMKKHKSADTLDTNVKPSAVSVAPPGDSEFAVPNAPRRKKKERKENVPPSPSLEHRAPNSIERVKAALQNSGEQGRISRARPASVMQTSYTGSVERARQNFQSKPKNGEDTTSVSEKSMDSRGENEQDDEYDRYPVSVSLSVNEKAWMLKSCQGDMVEMRKLLDNDPTLLEKKDFISGYTALHWAAKKGNKDMLHMLLDLKVEVNVKSNGGYTPLHLAAMNGHEDIIISLLQHDANPKMRDFSGRLPIHYLKLDMSLPLQKLLFGSEQMIVKGFAAGLRPHETDSRKTNRLSSAISGGLTSVGALMSRSSEDVSKLDEPNRPGRSGSFRNKMSRKKHGKSTKERPTITLVTADESDSGFGSIRSSVVSLPLSASTPNLQRSTPNTPNPSRAGERARSNTDSNVI